MRSKQALRPGASRAVRPDALSHDGAAERVLGLGLALAVAGVALQSVAHLVDLWAFDLEVEVVRAESDTSAWAWASIVATFTAAVGALLLHAARFGRPARLAVLAAAVAFLSLDDMIQVHERLSALVTDLGAPEEWHLARLFWVAVFLPLLAVTFLLLWDLSRTLPARFGRLVLAGAVLLVVAVGLEVVSPALFWLGFDHGDLLYELEVVLEEGAELGGWAVVGTALVAAALDRLERPRLDGVA